MMDFNFISLLPLFSSLFSAVYSFSPIPLFCLFVSFTASLLRSLLLFPLVFSSLLFISPFQAASALPSFPLQWCCSPALPAALCQLLALWQGALSQGPQWPPELQAMLQPGSVNAGVAAAQQQHSSCMKYL